MTRRGHRRLLQRQHSQRRLSAARATAEAIGPDQAEPQAEAAVEAT